MAPESLDEAIRAVAQFLVAEVPLGETLERIAHLAVDAVGPAAATGITLLDGADRPTTAVYTAEIAPEIDQVQYDTGQGPCLEAYRQGAVIQVDDTRGIAARWPAFSEETTRHGVFSTLSIPLGAAGKWFGALNLYAKEPQAFDDSDHAVARAFGIQAAVVLANAQAYWSAFELGEGLRSAMESRGVIEQAKGMLMAEHGCRADEAFEILVRASQRQNMKLRDIAQALVEARTGPGRPTD